MFEFGDFRFDPAGPSLTRGSKLIDLAPKALEIFSVLLANSGQVVRKEDLLSVVWPGVAVEEGNLAVHVCSVRKALADGAWQIQTVPKRGYRFAGAVRRVWTPGLVSHDPTVPLRIAEHYLHQNTASGCRKAAATYRKCIEKDPLDVKARAGLADSLLMRFIFGDLGREEGIGAALRILARASEIHPGFPDTYISRSRLLCVWDCQWQRAADELQRGLELAIDDATRLAARAWQGVCLGRMGDLDRGLCQLRQASAAFPLSPHCWYFLAEAQYLARDFSGCLASCTEGLELHPNCW